MAQNQTIQSETEVLIVGAGPTGLTLAADLLRRGIRVRIIDMKPRQDDKSKAIAVQAGTLEAIDSTLGTGVSDKMVARGIPASQANIHVGKNPTMSLDLSIIQSKYNYILMLAQNLTEQILSEELTKYKGFVEWNLTLTGLTQMDNSVTCELSSGTGQKESVSSKYVVGCDGAHSAVRKLLDIPFVGSQYHGEFILGDVQIQWAKPYGAAEIFISEKGIMPWFPLNDSGRYRLILVPRNFAPSAIRDVSLEEFSKIAATLGRGDFKITNAYWLTRFRVHHRLCFTFGWHRVYIAGDAAHIHSPAGGQGMNTGIQDALNLSHKIFGILRKSEKIELLKQYENERLPVARNVVRSTDFAFKLALSRENFLTKLARNFLIPKMIKKKFLIAKIIQALSEVSIARREIKSRNEK